MVLLPPAPLLGSQCHLANKQKILLGSLYQDLGHSGGSGAWYKNRMMKHTCRSQDHTCSSWGDTWSVQGARMPCPTQHHWLCVRGDECGLPNPRCGVFEAWIQPSEKLPQGPWTPDRLSS